MYYFTIAKRKSRGRKNSILERSAGNGYWHMNGQNIPIKFLDEVAGHKTALKYYHYDKNKKGVQTKWIMNEYRLKYLADDFNLDEELVLCRIQKAKTGREVEEEIISSNENQSSLVAHHQATLPQVPVSSVPVPYDASERPGSKRLRRDNTYNGTQYYNTGSTSMAPVPEAATTPAEYQHDQYCYNTITSVPDQQYYQQQYGSTTSTVPVPDHHQYFSNTTDVPHHQQQQQQQQYYQQESLGSIEGASNGYCNNQMNAGAAVGCTSVSSIPGLGISDVSEGDHASQCATLQSDHAVNCQAPEQEELPMENVTTVAPACSDSDMQHASEAGNQEGCDFGDSLRMIEEESDEFDDLMRTMESPTPSFMGSESPGLDMSELHDQMMNIPLPYELLQQQQQHYDDNECRRRRRRRRRQ